MDHYKVLGVSEKASKGEIKEAFKKLAVKFHPDKHSHSSDAVKNNSLERFKQVSEAYDVLMDNRKRAQYNLRPAAGGGSGYCHNSYGYAARPASSSSSSGPGIGHGVDFEVVFRYVTRRSFLLNLAFASVLFGGTIVIQSSGETLWKMQNSGKSFEEAMESIEKIKTQKEKR